MPSLRSRRGWVIGVVALGTAALLGAAFWFLFVPNWRPPLRDGEVYGIDVSHHQGAIDWDAVRGDGIGFAYLKASEGGDFADPRFDDNWRGAASAGLMRGAYHFFTLCRPGDEQARWFLEVASPDADALPPAVDLEVAGNCADPPDAAAVNAELEIFLRMLERAWEREAILYVGDDYAAAYPVPARLDRRRWHRRFLLRPAMDDWLVWQLHGYARVAGVEGQVDVNVGRLARLTTS